MGRKKIERMVKEPPLYSSFKPSGVPRRGMEILRLSLDEFEAIKLADYEGFNHHEASLEMGISRSTFSRLIVRARNKVATFMIEGKELAIEGGEIHFRDNIYQCSQCFRKFRKTIHEKVGRCPSCGSEELFDFAGGFGHGKCCRHGKSS